MKTYLEVAGRQGTWRTFRFDADGRAANWILHDSYCDDPACTGMEVRIMLLVDGEPDRRLSFGMDLADSALRFGPEIEEPQRAIAVEFASSPSVQRLLWRRRSLVRAWALSRRRKHCDGVLIEEGLCYSLDEFDPSGDQHVIHFKSNDVTWAAMDIYCIAPSCDCNEAVLEFFCHDSEDEVLQPQFTARLDLADGRLTEGKSSAPLPPDRRRVVADLQEEITPWRAELGLRRKLIRRIGAKCKKKTSPSPPPEAPSVPIITEVSAILAPPAASGIHRNDPCPCGSGRKYKKCCAARHPSAPTRL